MTTNPADDPVGTIRLNAETGEVRIAQAMPDHWVPSDGRWITVTDNAAPLTDTEVEAWEVLTAVPCTPAAPYVDMRIVTRAKLDGLTFDRDTARANVETMARLYQTYAEDYLGLPDTTPVAEVHEHVVNALSELAALREVRTELETLRSLYLPSPDSMPVSEIAKHIGYALRELHEWRTGHRTQEGTASELFDLAKARHAEIISLTKERDRAESSRQAWALEADRLDQENEHLRRDLSNALATIASNTGSIFAAADRAFQAWTAGTGETWSDHLNAVPDATGRWIRVADAVLSDPLAAGTRVRIGKCYGTVERAPRRVRVRLDGAPAGDFDAQFVHPVTDEEQAAERVVEVDPPPAPLAARVAEALKRAQEPHRG
jgi:hypothetical protein